MLTKGYSGWRGRDSEFTNIYLEEIIAKFPCRKVVAVHQVIVYTARILCFYRFPAAPLQPRTPACMENHFPGPHCGKTHSLRPNKTIFPHKSWPDRRLQRKDNGTAYANSNLRMRIQRETLARQKTLGFIHILLFGEGRQQRAASG